MPETKSWTEFYQGRLLSKGYREYAAKRYAPFLDEIIRNIKAGDRIIEIGCGLATITSILADRKCHHTIPYCGVRCFDLDPAMVKLARTNLYEGYPVDVGDARLPTGRLPDIIHSHGLLEHLSDEDIRKVVKAGNDDGARVAVHYVPGAKYPEPSFGDERLMELQQWQAIANPTHTFKFNDDHDYVLIWRY